MDKEKFLEEFNRGQVLRLGRIMLILAVILLLAVPFLMGAIYRNIQGSERFYKQIIKVGVVYIPVEM